MKRKRFDTVTVGLHLLAIYFGSRMLLSAFFLNKDVIIGFSWAFFIDLFCIRVYEYLKKSDALVDSLSKLVRKQNEMQINRMRKRTKRSK